MIHSNNIKHFFRMHDNGKKVFKNDLVKLLNSSDERKRYNYNERVEAYKTCLILDEYFGLNTAMEELNSEPTQGLYMEMNKLYS